MKYQLSEVAQLLGTSAEAIESWSGELEALLSPAARPQATAKDPQYTSADIVVLCRAQVLLWQQHSFSAIREILAARQHAPDSSLPPAEAPSEQAAAQEQPPGAATKTAGGFRTLALSWPGRAFSIPAALAAPKQPSEGSAAPAAARNFPAMLAGIVLAFTGQYSMLRTEPLLQIGLSRRLNVLFAINVPNPENTLLGVVLLAIGVTLFVLGMQPLALPVSTRPSLSLKAPGYAGDARYLYGLLVAALVCFGLLIQQLAAAAYSSGLVLLWLITLALVLAAAYTADRRARVRLMPKLERLDILLIAAIGLAGLAVGTYQLDQLPASIVGDEGSFFENARLIAAGQFQPPIFTNGVYSYPVLGSIYQGWMLRLFGPTLWAWRFSSVLMGVLALPPTYLLARAIFSRRVAMLACLLMIVTPYFIAFERLGYNNAQSIPLVVFGVYMIYRGLRRGSALYLALSGVVAGLGFYTYTAGRLTLFIAGFVMLGLLGQGLFQHLRRQSRPSAPAESLRRLAAIGALFMLGFAVTALPQLVYSNAIEPRTVSYKLVESLLANVNYARDFYPDAQLFRDAAPIQVGSETFFYRADLYAILFIRGLARSLLAFSHNQLIGEHYIHSPLAGPAVAIFCFFGIAVAVKQVRSKGVALLLFWFFGGVVVLSAIHSFPPRYQHTVPLIPAMSIFTALGIVVSAESIVGRLWLWRRQVTWLAISAVLLLAIVTGLRNYFVEVQAFYPPTLPNLAVTRMLQTTAPRRMVYIAEDANEVNFIPWLQSNAAPGTELIALAPGDIGRLQIEPGHSYIFFFHAQSQPAIMAYLEHALGKPIVPEQYRDAQGNTVGLLYSFTS